MIISLIFLLIFIIFSYYVFMPLFSENNKFDDCFDNKGLLNTYKNNLIKQIKELDFEKEMGITTEEDYKFIKKGLIKEVEKINEKE